MEIEGREAVVTKKAWNIVRVLLLMLRKGIAKSKMIGELHFLLKRGKLAGKAMVNNLILNLNLLSHHQHRSHNNITFIAPCDYEFSCSNSPAIPAKRSYNFSAKRLRQYDHVATLAALHNIVNNTSHPPPNNNSSTFSSYSSPLPGFGKSPVGRQLRVTDSPFPLNDDHQQEDEHQVDVAAEEFIQKFYKDLFLQKNMSALCSPYHNFSLR